MLKKVHYQLKPMTTLLRELVAIDSQVGRYQAILSAQGYIANLLQQLYFETEYVDHPSGHEAPLLIGRKYVGKFAPTVTLIGHSDVVTSSQRIPFDEDGDRIYGAGVADDKGGVIVGLQALADFLNHASLQMINLNMVISPSEETGSLGFHSVFSSLGRESDYVLGLEPALTCGSVISSRSGNRWYHLKSYGMSAHAGRFGHKHINAAHALSNLIMRMQGLTDEEKLRRVQIGSLGTSQEGFNTICGEAWARADVRFANFDDREQLHQQIELMMSQSTQECPYSGQEGHFIYSIEDDCPPLAMKKPDGVISTYFKKVQHLERRAIGGIHSGGAADINYFSHRHNVLLDGLGPVGSGLHTRHESIEKKSLITRSQALTTFLLALNQLAVSKHGGYHDYDSFPAL